MATRALLRFVFVALLYFAVLMSLASTGFYPPLFRAGATLLFHRCGSHRIAKFEPVVDPQGINDTNLFVGTDVHGTPEFPIGIGIDTVRKGYTPTALLAALILATPIPWRRRWKALVVGLLLVQVFVVLRLAITLMYGFSQASLGADHLLELGRTGKRLLWRTHQVFSVDLHMTYVAPILIWLFVTRSAGKYLLAQGYGWIPSSSILRRRVER